MVSIFSSNFHPRNANTSLPNVAVPDCRVTYSYFLFIYPIYVKTFEHLEICVDQRIVARTDPLGKIRFNFVQFTVEFAYV